MSENEKKCDVFAPIFRRKYRIRADSAPRLHRRLSICRPHPGLPVHAEHNVLLQAAVLGSMSTKDSTMYTKYSPCIHCSKYIATCGIKRVVIGKIYRNDKAVEYLREAGLEVDIYQENKKWNDEMSKLFKGEIEEAVAKEGKVIMRQKK